MAYVWFNLVLEAIGKKLNYDSISNLYGNSFAKDAAKIIQAANPLVKGNVSKGGTIADLVGTVKIIDASQTPEAAKKAVEASLGDVSWAEGLF
jgi:hypothetical protein